MKKAYEISLCMEVIRKTLCFYLDYMILIFFFGLIFFFSRNQLFCHASPEVPTGIPFQRCGQTQLSFALNFIKYPT